MTDTNTDSKTPALDDLLPRIDRYNRAGIVQLMRFSEVPVNVYTTPTLTLNPLSAADLVRTIEKIALMARHGKDK